MNGNEALDESIGKWLQDDAPTGLPRRVLEAAFDRTRRTRQKPAWRALRLRHALPRFVPALAGAAAFVLGAIVAINVVPRLGSGVPPSPSPSTSNDGSLPEGRFALWKADRADVQVSVTIPASGWFGTPDEGFLIKNANPAAPDALGVVVYAEANRSLPGTGGLYVYPDACRWSTGQPPELVRTVDEAVAALARQASRNTGTPADITVGGKAGRSIALRVAAGLDAAGCDEGEFRTLIEGTNSPRGFTASDTVDELWIVDPGGSVGLVIFDLVYDDAIPPSLIDELRIMVASAIFR